MQNQNQVQNKGERIAKVIAASGYCSRREAESLIEEGRVQVNGKTIESPATFITDEAIKIDNKLIEKSQELRVFVFHKPKGVITSSKDEKNRPIIYDYIDKKLPRLIAIGRLDFNTEGLLLLTTKGELSRFIELPKTAWIRKYRARVFGKINQERLEKLKNGITIDGVRYGSIKVEIESQVSANSWLTISITEGKNREIRKVMEELGLQVNRLVRVSFGPFSLEDLKVGEIKEINKNTLKNYLPAKFF
jgi:23S rRNA pseudouridine2605 synthase